MLIRTIKTRFNLIYIVSEINYYKIEFIIGLKLNITNYSKSLLLLRYSLKNLVMIIYLMIFLYFENGCFKIDLQFGPSDFIDEFLIVDIIAELVFRGRLLNAFFKKDNNLSWFNCQQSITFDF